MKNLISYIKESLRIGICDEFKVSVCESLRIGINDTPEMTALDIFNNHKCDIKQDMSNGMNKQYSIVIYGDNAQRIYDDLCNIVINTGENISEIENIYKLIDNGEIIASIYNATKGELIIETKIFGDFFQLRIFLQSNKTCINAFLIKMPKRSSLCHLWEFSGEVNFYKVNDDLFNDMSQFIHDNDTTSKIDTILKL